MELAKLAYELKSGDWIDFVNGTEDDANCYGGWCGIKKIDDFDQDNLQYLIGSYGGIGYTHLYNICEWDPKIGDFCKGKCGDADVLILCIARAIANYIIAFEGSVNKTIFIEK